MPLVALVALAGSGCERSPSVDEPVPTDSTPGNAAPADHAAAGTRLSRVALDADAVARAGRVDVTLAPGDVSLLLTFVLEDPEAGIGIARVHGPDGTLLHHTTFASDSWEATAFASVVAGEPLAANGELALFLPVSPATPLVPGDYRVTFETDPPDAALARVERTLKRVDDDASGPDGDTRPFDARPQRVDLHVHVLHVDAAFRDAGFAGTVERDWRDALELMLAPHALGIGAITVTVADEAASVRLAELDDEAEITAACRSAREALPGAPAAADAVPLHVAFVAEIVDAEGDAWLTGLAPQPGHPFDDASPGGCVLVGERAWAEDRLDPDTVVALLAANLLHELGHFAGLAHPSEVDGTTFDLLDDTPRCTVPDPLDCGTAGGADNVMFHSGDADTLPWTLSADQAWVLRRHPLFR